MDSPSTPNDLRDGAYIPSPPVVPGPNDDISGARQKFDDQFSDAARDKTTARQCCAITHTPYSVEYAHILPIDTPRKILERLEYFWGMQWGSLNVDTRYNVMRLEVALHTLFDQRQWILLPDEKTIQALLDLAILGVPSGRFQAFIQGKETYQYTLVPAPSLHALQLWQYKDNIPPDEIACPSNLNGPYYFPFENFPVITSHVRPHFAICNIGLKAEQAGFESNFLISEYLDESTRALIGRTVFIFRNWDSTIPAGSKFCAGPPHEPDDRPDDNSRKTRSGRGYNREYDRTTRRRRDNDLTPTNKSSCKRQRQDDPRESDEPMLTDKTLHEIRDDQASEGTQHRMNALPEWASIVAKQP